MPPRGVGLRVYTLLTSKLTEYLESPKKRDNDVASAKRVLEPTVLENLDAVINSGDVSYPAALLIQVAWAIEEPGVDTTRRQKGGRGVAAKLGAFMRQHDIPGPADAFQNIGKNTPQLTRGNFPQFDRLLEWAKRAKPEELYKCLDYACGLVAATARHVEPWPGTRVAQLTFRNVMAVLNELLASASEGVYEQYIVASLLDSLIKQEGGRGEGRRVETKRATASDKSSRAAGDIEVKIGARTVEAYEVTAADWKQKLAPVLEKLRHHGISKAHVVAPIGTSYEEVLQELLRISEDISVLDLLGLVAAMVSMLDQGYREDALKTLHSLLRRYDYVDLANRLVQVLRKHKLAAE